MKISVCMMVRNEEALLGRALASTLGLADEVVIVDTGSTDGTIQLAKQFGARVLTGGDRRHKAQERNRGILAATGDWVVILDADEVIADPLGVRAYLEQTTAQAVYIRETFMDGDRATLSFHQMRCWRRGTFLYRYRAHEVPLPTEGWGACVYSDMVWEHRPPATGREWKREHMLMLLCMDVEEWPDDPRPLYYLSREYLYLGAWQACIEVTGRYLAVLGDAEVGDRAEAYGNLATCYDRLGQPTRKIEMLHRALAAEPHRREWYGLLAEHYHAAGLHAVAAAILRGALELPQPATGYIVAGWYGSHIYDLLARCYWYAGRKAEGKPYARRAYELAPQDARLAANYAFFEAVNDGCTAT